MFTLKEATNTLRKALVKGTVIKAGIEYGEDFLFLAIGPDELEGRYDPFYKVNKKTGAVRDFSPQDYANPREILDQLNPAGR